MKTFNVLAVMLSAALFATGCASYSTSMVRLDSFGPNTIRQTNEDLSLLMEEYATKEKCKKAFDANLADNAVLPLLIALQNNGTQPYESKNMDIVLRDGDTLVRSLSPEQAASKAKRSALGRALGWSLIVPIVAIPVAATASAVHTGKVNDKIVQDFKAKTYPEGVVLPNHELAGFLFFQLGQGRKDLTGLKLQMTVRNVTTGTIKTLTAVLPDTSFRRQTASK